MDVYQDKLEAFARHRVVVSMTLNLRFLQPKEKSSHSQNGFTGASLADFIIQGKHHVFVKQNEASVNIF